MSKKWAGVGDRQWDKNTERRFGFNPWEVALRATNAVLREMYSVDEPCDMFVAECSFKKLTQFHATLLRNVIAMAPYSYASTSFFADQGVAYLSNDFSLELTINKSDVNYELSPEMFDQEILAMWFAGNPGLALSIHKDPNWEENEQNRIFMVGCFFLQFRSLSMMERTLFVDAFISLFEPKEKHIRNIIAKDPSTIKENLLYVFPEEISNFAKFCSQSYFPLYWTAVQCDTLKNKVKALLDENTRLKSKTTRLTERNEELSAVARMKESNLQQQIDFLQVSVDEKSRAIAQITRENKDTINSLNEELDREKTQVQLLLRFIEQQDALECSTPALPKDECINEDDLGLDTMKVLVVGGHENFLNKLRQRFPNWIIPGDALFTSEPTKVDVVIYIHLHCGHSLYEKGKMVAANTNAFELYTKSVNIDAFVKEVSTNLRLLLASASR